MSSVIAFVHRTFDRYGDQSYGSEAVTQRQHALQCGHLAQESKAPASQVVAALLHDFGHIVDGHAFPEDEDEDEDGQQSFDDRHEFRANGWLRRHFGAEVADPVRLHVLAKRYLCTVDPSYEAQLSPTSLKSYQDQGGPMSPDEVRAFEGERYYREALSLRRWDDAAKDPSVVTLHLEQFDGVLLKALNSG